MTGQDLQDFVEGERPSAGKLQLLVDGLRELLDRQNSAPNTLHTPWGDFQRSVPGGEGGGEWKFGTLVTNLSGMGGGEYAQVQIYERDSGLGTWEDTGETEDAYAPPLLPQIETLQAGTWVIIHKGADGLFYIHNAGCGG